MSLILTVTITVGVKRINENINIINFGEGKFRGTTRAFPDVRVVLQFFDNLIF